MSEFLKDYQAAKTAWIQAGNKEEDFDEWWESLPREIPEDCL